MFYPKRPRSYYMTPTRRQICKPLIRGSRCALTRRCLKDVGTSKYIIKRVGQLLRQEITSLCSDNFDSILHEKRISTVEGFSWGVITEEMKARAPTLLALLESSTHTRRARKNRKAGIGVITGILCKQRRPTASFL